MGMVMNFNKNCREIIREVTSDIYTLSLIYVKFDCRKMEVSVYLGSSIIETYVTKSRFIFKSIVW